MFQVEAGCEAIAVFGEAFGELIGFFDIAADHEGTVGGEGGLATVFGGTAQSCGEGRLTVSASVTGPAVVVVEDVLPAAAGLSTFELPGDGRRTITLPRLRR
ncbi:hypothetical protein EN35_33360 [Rhodococcus qingshengii]|nr:hypothetical protein EN35_33360 [Rhodococcus qingshengii]